MPDRRSVLSGLCAATLSPGLAWADVGRPAYLSAARAPSGDYRLCGIDTHGAVLFDLPLPDRGHAAAAHPTRPEAVAFARRPGRFALVLDCHQGTATARLDPPANRHFYGHGTYSADGSILYTTENDLDTLQGRIGLWDAIAGYARIGDIASGGVGPHDVARLPGSEVLTVANGGIETHPDTDRTALNPATMRANLAFLDPSSGQATLVQLDPSLRQNSIRHLDVRADGLVAAGMQWQGPSGQVPPLLMLASASGLTRLLEAPAQQHRALQDYVGSVAFSADGETVAITSPRGGSIQLFNTGSGNFLREMSLTDVCGLASTNEGFLASSGSGTLARYSRQGAAIFQKAGWRWDNHLVPLQQEFD